MHDQVYRYCEPGESAHLFDYLCRHKSFDTTVPSGSPPIFPLPTTPVIVISTTTVFILNRIFGTLSRVQPRAGTRHPIR